MNEAFHGLHCGQKARNLGFKSGFENYKLLPLSPGMHVPIYMMQLFIRVLYHQGEDRQKNYDLSPKITVAYDIITTTVNI